MTFTYGGYDIAAMTGKYNIKVVPRFVVGTNGIDSIAGTHEPDILDFKKDIIVECWPLTENQLTSLWTLAEESVSNPYQWLNYVSGNITISGEYRISVGQSASIIDTDERKYHGGVVLTFTQR